MHSHIFGTENKTKNQIITVTPCFKAPNNDHQSAQFLLMCFVQVKESPQTDIDPPVIYADRLVCNSAEKNNQCGTKV
jgi:hypothetical protein